MGLTFAGYLHYCRRNYLAPALTHVPAVAAAAPKAKVQNGVAAKRKLENGSAKPAVKKPRASTDSARPQKKASKPAPESEEEDEESEESEEESDEDEKPLASRKRAPAPKRKREAAPKAKQPKPKRKVGSLFGSLPCHMSPGLQGSAQLLHSQMPRRQQRTQYGC